MMTCGEHRNLRSRERRPWRVFNPAVDVHENAEFYLVSVDIPGIAQKDIKIDVQNGRLSVSGERTRQEVKDEKMFRRFERSHGHFERTFQLPQDIKEEKSKLILRMGSLKL